MKRRPTEQQIALALGAEWKLPQKLWPALEFTLHEMEARGRKAEAASNRRKHAELLRRARNWFKLHDHGCPNCDAFKAALAEFHTKAPRRARRGRS